jgi:adenylosuccinate lyase
VSSLSAPSRYDRYENPLVSRYASPEMVMLFSSRSRITAWRRLWLWLAEAQQELGLPIPGEALEELRNHLVPSDEEMQSAARHERQTLHDVMAHVHALGEAAPAAKGIIHLGATSCFVTDNGDLLIMREALRLTVRRIVRVMNALAAFAREHRALPATGFTHFQTAQPTTVGKRACLWLQDLLFDYREISRQAEILPFLGCKGATGTQASFVALFDGDKEKTSELDRRVSQKAGFSRNLTIASQTYTRKIDSMVLAALSGLASTAGKLANDVRLLQHLKEIEEPFGSLQVGSSAMPYKRNPMKSERINSLARWLITVSANGAWTHSHQWLERTLDDSANRRLALGESFLTADALLVLMEAVVSGFHVHPKVIEKRLATELPFVASENILMAAARKGGDRQVLHEEIRLLSRAAADRLSAGETTNDLLERIAANPVFGLSVDELAEIVRPELFIGRAPEQVDEFLDTEIAPILAEHEEDLQLEATEVVV